MTSTHGFELLRERSIPELNTLARFYRHIATGAQLLSFVNDDENKCFAIVFPTFPEDASGVAHILEHAVLCGSRRYRVKEPFKELLKGSLRTFLNAFTYPDRTIYPVASQNLQDFYNLIEVYLDAVFFPLLTPESFAQEGWHYETTDGDGRLAFSGVVYNEMKGAYSSPEDLLQTAVLTTLLPDTVYGHDSGGDPRHIPDLTYERLLAFHRTYYHPSRALLFFYGDDPPEERLVRMDTWLSEVAAAYPPPPPLPPLALRQPPFPAPQQLRRPYVPGEDAQTYVTVNWALPPVEDPTEALALTVLGHVLIGTPASPLRKALIDSGLGEDITGLGLVDDVAQPVFSTGLKGVEETNAPAVEQLVLTTLGHLAAEGIDPRTVAASLHTVEFQLREHNTGGFPRGLALLLRGLPAWMYGADPIAWIAFAEPWERLRQATTADPRYFEGLIRRYLLDNPHRTTLLLVPDPNLAAEWEAQERARLEAAQASLTPAAWEALRRQNEALRLWQEMPDPPEALAAIPRLRLSDLDRTNKRLPLADLDYRGVPILYHDLFTNGIGYLDLGLNLRMVPPELLPYVPLFARGLLETGAGEQDFVALTQRIGMHTGGIVPTLFTGMRRGDGQPCAWLFLRGKAMVPKAGELLAILRDVLAGARLDDRERIRQIVLEEKANQEAALLPAGLAFVAGRLAGHFHSAGWAAEQMSGVNYLLFLRRLAAEIESDWPAVYERLETLRRLLINRQAMLWNVTLDEANWSQVQPQLQALLDDLPARPTEPAAWSLPPAPPAEGLILPGQVNYVGKAADLYALGYRLHGSIHVITNYLRLGRLWERVRMQGGAYGVSCQFDQRSGVLHFVSYRDPQVLATLAVYDETADFLARVELNDEELSRAIIGVIGQMDAYLLPDAKGWVAMQRYLLGEGEEFRQQLREEVLGTTVADFHALAEVLQGFKTAGHVVILGPETALSTSGLDLSLTRVL
ncbi:MAG: insulinase family protein [Anaerolineae bacterium]|nr:insulinase family protein [Caldilineales bacterium]MCX7852138.1 insulinase family protein [Caldilineales bacterium]MDW8269082.1 insulinase family protein [Anaerolineae bacterium]